MRAEVTTHIQLGRKNLDRPSMDQLFQFLLDRSRTALYLDQVKTIFGFRKGPCRRKLRQARYGVVVRNTYVRPDGVQSVFR